MTKQINNKNYYVESEEFNIIPNDKYPQLVILENLNIFERIISLLIELSNIGVTKSIFFNITHGGFIPLECSEKLNKVFILNTNEKHISNIKKNVELHNANNISYLLENNNDNYIVFSENSKDIDMNIFNNYESILLTTKDNRIIEKNIYKHIYELTNTNLCLYIPDCHFNNFLKEFHYFINNDNKLSYDNLINLCIMVKNGGESLEKMLIENLNIIDRWTILDTGSTDNTVDNINKILVGKKKGNLYQESFINFRESRNRCLDLAKETCKFNLMLDDTYIIKGDLRNFLNEVRGDQFSNSFSLRLVDDTLECITNRITKSKDKLRYIYTMHEVVQTENNVNACIPKDVSYIFEEKDEYMKKRTHDRLKYDLECLYEMIKDPDHDSRHLFYLGQTYYLLEDYEKSAEFFHKRAFCKNDGFLEEKYDALFQYGFICNFKLNKSWEECEKIYNLYNEKQPSRPEGFFYIGYHYYISNEKSIAFNYFKKAFEIGFPYNQQYSLRPNISFGHVPYFLCELCYIFQDYRLGYNAYLLYLQKNKENDMYYKDIVDWYKIYEMLNKMPPLLQNPVISEKEILCFVADGGFTKWSGKSIYKSGVGGSETWIIEMAKSITKNSNYEVIVFCDCEENELCDSVKYYKLNEYFNFISKFKIKHCIISRFSEYIPVTINSFVENIHVVLHDIKLSGNIIPIHNKIKNIFCLTEWHKITFLQSFPQFTNITNIIHHGINFDQFLNNEVKKEEFSFIYSSFPNRGLLTVLKMWPKIQHKYPKATLNLFVDIHNDWANKNYPEEMLEIINTLEVYKVIYSSIKIHGWVSKDVLSYYWKKSHIWFYPCKFLETFCLTALEAAISKTLVITNDLAGLQETVGDRGIIITGDSTTEEWQKEAFNKISECLDNPIVANKQVQKNYEWALEHSWENIGKLFLKNLESFKQQ